MARFMAVVRESIAPLATWSSGRVQSAIYSRNNIIEDYDFKFKDSLVQSMLGVKLVITEFYHQLLPANDFIPPRKLTGN